MIVMSSPGKPKTSPFHEILDLIIPAESLLVHEVTYTDLGDQLVDIF